VLETMKKKEIKEINKENFSNEDLEEEKGKKINRMAIVQCIIGDEDEMCETNQDEDEAQQECKLYHFYIKWCLLGLLDDENHTSEDDIEDDEWIGSRPLTPESINKEVIDGFNIMKKPIVSTDIKQIFQSKVPGPGSNKNKTGNPIRGTFTWKIIK